MAEDNNKLVLYFALLILLLLLVLLFQAYNSKCKVFNTEQFNNTKSNADVYNEMNVMNSVGMQNDTKYAPVDPEQSTYTEVVSTNENAVNVADVDDNVSCYPRSSLTAKDLLPADLDATNSKWASMNPTTGGAIEDQNLLTAGWTVGVNTVQNSLRNPNLQLRSEPPNPVKPVSPWMISTIGPDTNRRDMEIGSQPYWEN